MIRRISRRQVISGAILAVLVLIGAYFLFRPAPEPTVGKFITEEEVLQLVAEDAPASAYMEYPHLLESSGFVSPILPMKVDRELCWLSVRGGSVLLLDRTQNEVLKTYQ